jgi:hypothetical protein
MSDRGEAAAGVPAGDDRPGRWRPAILGPRDRADVLALFEQVFGGPMSEALSDWKYGAGRGLAGGVRDDEGRLLAHYGGTLRELCLGARCFGGIQMGDVMVRADGRGILSRRGPFASLASFFIDATIGEAPRAALGFGFPNDRHSRLGELLGLYLSLGEVRELRWPAAAGSGWPGPRWQLVPAGRTRADRERLDRCWRTMRAALPDWVLPRRDPAWCEHRYAAHPHHDHRMLWLRCRYTRRVAGALVIREHAPAGAAGERTWECMDWIGEPRYLAPALEAACAAAHDQGVAALQGWFSAPIVERFLAAPQRLPPPTQTVVCRWCASPRRAADVPPAVDTAPWWLTSGDTDFR